MIDYNNKIFDIVDKVRDLVANETTIPIFFDSHQGNHSILIQPLSDNLTELIATGQTRSYAVSISYELHTGGNYTQNTLKQVTNVAEHIKRLFAPDNNFSVSGYWHNAEIESVEYEREEGDESVVRALLTFNCLSLEVS